MDLAEIPEDSVIDFPDGVPGLGDLRRFALLKPADLGPIVVLQSVEDKHVSLPLVPAQAVYAEYRLQLDSSELQALRARDVNELAPLAVLVLPGSEGVAACNLLAPIVVNFESRLGRQVVQSESDYPTLYPLTGE